MSAKQTTQVQATKPEATPKAPRVFSADLFKQAGVMSADGEDLAARVAAMLQGEIKPAEYKAARAAFIEGYMSKPGKTKKAATTAWERFCKAFKVLRPQATSKAAAKKRAQRQASKTGKAGTNPQAGDSDDDTNPIDDPKAPASGAKVAKQVTMMLSTMEAHLLSMLRAGKFAQVHELVRSMEGAV